MARHTLTKRLLYYERIVYYDAAVQFTKFSLGKN
jgi:hypothetical protein